MTDFNGYLDECMKDPEFKKEYDDLAVEYEIKQAMIDARKEKKLTQKDLSKLTGIQQSHISRLENANYNPSIAFLKRIAHALDKELHIEFR
jgi:predicted transcriptional regulator